MKFKLLVLSLLSAALLAGLLSCAETPTDGGEVTTTPLPCAHEFGDPVTEIAATCTQKGKETVTCTICGEFVEREIPYADHTFTRTVHAPSCTKQGYTEYVCTCGYTLKADYLPMAAHALTATRILPTCETEGHTHYACDNCPYEYDADVVAPTGHRLSAEVISPTCTEPGSTHYACLDCPYEYDVAYVQPLGHEFETTTVRPTASWPGYTTYDCTVCPYVAKGDYVYYTDILESAYVSSSEVLAKGLDVSRWNHQVGSDNEWLPLDWDAIKAAGFDYVILKAGSSNGKEPTFDMDYEGAKAAGLEVGAYYYTYATTVEGIKTDAADFLAYVEGKQFEYPVYLDIEDDSQKKLGKNLLSDMCETFLSTLQLEGYYAALYTNHEWLNTILDTARFVSRYDIWYARYPGTSDPTWDEDKYGKQLGMWQYTYQGTIEGCTGNFDFNYAYRDYAAIMKEWGLNGY